MKHLDSSFLKLVLLFSIFYFSLFLYFVDGANRLNFIYDLLFSLPLIFLISKIKNDLTKNLFFLILIFIFLFYCNFYKITGSFINKEYITYYLKEWKNVYNIILHNINLTSAAIVLFLTLSSYFIIKNKHKHANSILVSSLLILAVITPHRTVPSVLKNLFINDDKKTSSNQAYYPYSEIKLKEVKSKNNNNVLLIVIESMRYSTFNKNIDKLKNIKSLLNESTYFEKSYTTTSHTSKALVGILCGVHPHPIIDIIETKQLANDCLPKIYQSSNFETYFFQSATRNFENRESLVKKMGFHNFVSKENLDPKFENSGYFGIDEMALVQPVTEAFSKDGAFFITVLTSMTHHPYQEIGDITHNEIEKLKQGYLNNLIHTDQMIGELISKLKKIGKYDNTTIIITGDHGEGFGEHLGLYQHDFIPFETVTRVPLIIKSEVTIQNVSKKLNQHIDLYPTLLNTNFILESEFKRPGINLFSDVEHPYIVTSCWSSTCGSIIDQDNNKYYKFNKEQYGMTNLNTDPNEQHIKVLYDEKLANYFSTHEDKNRNLYNHFK